MGADRVPPIVDGLGFRLAEGKICTSLTTLPTFGLANRFFLLLLLVTHEQPLLTAYELQVALGEASWSDVYPMDYYSSSGGPWSNNVKAHLPK